MTKLRVLLGAVAVFLVAVLLVIGGGPAFAQRGGYHGGGSGYHGGGGRGYGNGYDGYRGFSGPRFTHGFPYGYPYRYDPYAYPYAPPYVYYYPY